MCSHDSTECRPEEKDVHRSDSSEAVMLQGYQGGLGGTLQAVLQRGRCVNAHSDACQSKEIAMSGRMSLAHEKFLMVGG